MINKDPHKSLHREEPTAREEKSAIDLRVDFISEKSIAQNLELDQRLFLPKQDSRQKKIRPRKTKPD